MTISACLEALDRAIDAGRRLGVETAAAEAVRETGRQRLGFPSAAYVLALVGGTGVGKSSLLNALAGEEVSRAGVVRPTTGQPVAWIPAGTRHELGELLEWLGIVDVRERAPLEPAPERQPGAVRDGRPPRGLGETPVAILDLPDLDSVEPGHRARVDALLPRIDAVAWVADPEKYHDAVLHDGYLRTWAPRLGRQALVLNKVDRVPSGEAERIRQDLLATLASSNLEGIPVLATSALPDAASRGGVADPDAASRGGVADPDAAGRGDGAGVGALEGWIVAGADAKQIVLDRLAADAGTAVAALLEAGVGPTGRVGAPLAGGGRHDPEWALIPGERRPILVDQVTSAVLSVVDLTGLERQAVAATRQAARPKGGGIVGMVTSRVFRISGRTAATADPAGYLRRWRERGSLARAGEPVRALVGTTLARVPPAARPAIAALADPRRLQDQLTRDVDRTVGARPSAFEPPRSRLWPVIGVAQSVALAALVLGAVWLVAGWLGAVGDPPTTAVPVLGSVPQPVLLVVGALIAMAILGRLLLVHAGLLGRRWADQLRGQLSAEIRSALETGVFRSIDELEGARRALVEAATAARASCRTG